MDEQTEQEQKPRMSRPAALMVVALLVVTTGYLTRAFGQGQARAEATIADVLGRAPDSTGAIALLGGGVLIALGVLLLIAGAIWKLVDVLSS